MDPFTISLLLEGANLGLNFLGGLQRRKAEREQRKTIKQLALTDIAAIQTKLQEDIGDIERTGASFKHEQRAMIGASGVKLSSGSPLALLQKTDVGIGRDIQRLKDQAAVDIERLRIEAGLPSGEEMEKLKKFPVAYSGLFHRKLKQPLRKK